MMHLDEEQLVLHYYGEGEDALSAERHLEECPECRAQYSALQRVLNVVEAAPVPERGPEYGAAVWKRIEGRLAPRRRGGFFGGLPRWRLAWAGAAMAGLLAAAFLAGRFTQTPRPAPSLAADPQARERILLAAMGDYLDRSQAVLVELANAPGTAPLDVSHEQERARELVYETRLYRQTAAATGAASMTGLLEDMERVLVDLARGPSTLAPADVDRWRVRLQAEAVIFKIRVVHSNVRSREEAESAPRAASPLAL